MAKTNQNTKVEEQVVETPVEEVVAPTFDIKAKFAELKTKSALIRFMASLPEFQENGKPSYGKINKAFGDAGIKMRYQHVRNVMITPVKKAA